MRSKKELKHGLWRTALYDAPHGLLSYTNQDHQSGVAPSTSSWALPYQSLIQEMTYRTINGSIFSSEAPSSHVTLAYQAGTNAFSIIIAQFRFSISVKWKHYFLFSSVKLQQTQSSIKYV